MRGCKKKVIFMKSTGSDFFDEAYFVLNDAADNVYLDERDMIAEATRIINESRVKKRPPTEERGRTLTAALWFAAGAIVSAGVTAAVTLLI